MRDLKQWITNLYTLLLEIWTKKRKKVGLNQKMQIAKGETFYRLPKWQMTPFRIEAVILLQQKAIEVPKAEMKRTINTLIPNPSWDGLLQNVSRYCLLKLTRKIQIQQDGLWVKNLMVFVAFGQEQPCIPEMAIDSFSLNSLIKIGQKVNLMDNSSLAEANFLKLCLQ